MTATVTLVGSFLCNSHAAANALITYSFYPLGLPDTFTLYVKAKYYELAVETDMVNCIVWRILKLKD